MKPLQVLAACGLISGILGALGGFMSIVPLVGLANFIMLVGNVYTLTVKERIQ